MPRLYRRLSVQAQETGNQKVFFRLYQKEKEWVPSVICLTDETEKKINPDHFATPYKYANEEQAERAMVYYVKTALGMTRTF